MHIQEGVVLPLLLNALLCAGCFRLAMRGFSAEGLPLTRAKRVFGRPAKLGALVSAVLGVCFLTACGVIVWWGLFGVR
jgi:hypothetical protein